MLIDDGLTTLCGLVEAAVLGAVILAGLAAFGAYLWAFTLLGPWGLAGGYAGFVVACAAAAYMFARKGVVL